MNSIEDLEKKFRFHDWYYQYSDDYRVWCDGLKSFERLLIDCEKFSIDEVRPLWLKYAPKEIHYKFESLSFFK